jgi:hypothetical protein
MGFFNSAEYTLREQTELFFTLNQLCCRKYFCQKLMQFSQENNVLDAAASNKDSFLWRDICVSSTQMKRHIWSKERQSPP